MQSDAKSGNRPGVRIFAISPSDVADLPVGTRWIYVGGAGHLKVSCVDDNAAHSGVVMTTVPAGSMIPVAARRIWATGTTATLLIGFA